MVITKSRQTAGFLFHRFIYHRIYNINIMRNYDVIIIGAGAAGLAAAAQAQSRGRRVAILDMGNFPARKVAASGGGRCNFTNAAVSANRYFGQNPNFVRGALARVTPDDILDWARGHNISWAEKSPGQYFCAAGAAAAVDALMHDVDNVDIFTNTFVQNVEHKNNEFIVSTDNAQFISQSVIVATGGTSFPTLGVSDVGYKIARQFGHKIIPVRPALCAIKTSIFDRQLAGISLDVEITVGGERIRDAMLFTHFGIGGPAVYRATIRDFDNLYINMAPGIDVYDVLRVAKKTAGRKSVASVLSDILPARVAKWVCPDVRHIADYRDDDIRKIAQRVNNIIIPHNDIKLHGNISAEVVRGGVDTAKVSSKTMESKLCPGLFFAGEVLDIAGDLGGFNLHWAWASGRVAGQNA